MAKNLTLAQRRDTALKKIAKLRSDVAIQDDDFAAAKAKQPGAPVSDKELNALADALTKVQGERQTDAQVTQLKNALGMLADANTRTMTVEAAYKWANEFIAEHPNWEAVFWAGRMVGHVEAHQASRRGPRPGQALLDLSEKHWSIIKRALRETGIESDQPSRADIDRLQRMINGNCDSQSLPYIDRAQIRPAVRKILREKGR